MEEVPLVKSLHDKYSGRGAVIVGLSVDGSVARADRTIKEKRMTWPQVADDKGFDSEMALTYGVNGTPTIFVIDRSGRIAARPSSAKQLEEPIAAALGTP